MPVEIVIVDDQFLSREYIRRVCTDVLGFVVLGMAASQSAAVELIRSKRPHLVLLDLSLGTDGGTGFGVADTIRKEMPDVSCVFMSVHCTEEVIRRVELARPLGFLDKNFHAAEVFENALRSVAEGKPYFSSVYRKALERRHRASNAYFRLLTDREQEILALIANAMTDAEIAALLGLAVSTVETHRHRILRKLGQDSTPKLMKFAIDCGFNQFGGPELPGPNCLV